MTLLAFGWLCLLILAPLIYAAGWTAGNKERRGVLLQVWGGDDCVQRGGVMNIYVKRNGQYRDVTVELGSGVMNLGLLNEAESRRLADEFQQAIDYLLHGYPNPSAESEPSKEAPAK